LICLFGHCQQFLHFGFELNFQFSQCAHAKVRCGARRWHAAWCRQDRLVPSLSSFHFLGQFQHLHKQLFQFAEKTPAERGQGVVVRMAAGGNVAESN